MKQKAKQRILKTASDLFHRQGYNSTGINQIIEEANVAKTTLYQYYRSKEDLAADYLSTRHSYWMNSLTDFVNMGSENKEKLLLAFDFISYMNDKENYRGCCFLNMLSEIQPDNRHLYGLITEHKQDLQFFLASLIKHKDRALQQQIYILYEGAMVTTKLYKAQWPVVAAKEFVSTLLI